MIHLVQYSYHCALVNGIIIITSRVPVEGEIISKAASSLPHKCRRSDYRRRGVSPFWSQIYIYTTKGDACVCVSVCKIWPISARTLSFRHQTSRKFFSHSNFPICYLWATAFCVCPLCFTTKIIKKPKMLGKRIDRRNRWSAQREEMNATLYCRLITRWRHGFLL